MAITTILMFIPIIISAIILDKSNVSYPLIITLIIFVPVFIITIVLYTKYVHFICPKCNQKFKPSNSAIIWSIHTPTKRKLKCPHCNAKSWCKEDF